MIIIELGMEPGLTLFVALSSDSVEHSQDNLNRNHLVLLLRVRYALVVLTALESKLLVIPVFLLLDQAVDK